MHFDSSIRRAGPQARYREDAELKIAHIAPRLTFRGGTERFVIEVDRAMRDLGAQSRIYSATTSLTPDYLGDLAVAIHLARRARKDGFDVLLFHQGQEAAMFFRGNETISYFHGAKYDLVSGATGRAYARFLGKFARRCPRIICNSHYTALRIGRTVDRDEIPVVYPGVRLAPQDSKGAEREQFCYYHSRFHPQKNHEFLLDIFSGLPYQLCLTGGTWDRKFKAYQRGIFQRASRMGNLLALSNIDESTKTRLMLQALVFLFPAKDEPFGLALLDAMASGKPVVALNSGATREVIGDAGIMCRPDIEEWRSSIISLFSDTERRFALGRKSRERAKLFTWARTARELIEWAEEWN